MSHGDGAVAERTAGAPDREITTVASSRSGRKLAANAAAGGVANCVKIGIQLVMLPLMAHLLGPSEFGLYAMALPTIAFSMILADGGLAASLAREPRESTLVWSTAFWLVLVVGLVLVAIVNAWGVLLAALAREPRVAPLMAMLSVSLVMISFESLPRAALTREGRLVVFSIADALSSLVGAALAIWLAASGAGARSLAAQYVTYYALRAVILNVASFVRPTFQFKLSALFDHLSVGSALLSVRLADFFGRLIENLLYGRAFGAAGLGVFTFANQAPRFICEAASGPIWAALYSYSLREPPERIPATHVNLVRLLAALVFPAAALISASAPHLLIFILGPKWADAGDLLRILIPFYGLQVAATISTAVLLAAGKGWLLFWISAVLVISRVAAVAAGPWVGETGVAFGIGAALTLYSLAMFAAPGHEGGTRRLLAAILGPAGASLGAGLASYAVLRETGGAPPWIVAAWVLGGLVYLTLLALLERKTIAKDVAALRGLLPGRRSPPSPSNGVAEGGLAAAQTGDRGA